MRLKSENPLKPKYSFKMAHNLTSAPQSTAMIIDLIGAYALKTNALLEDKNSWHEFKDREGNPLSLQISRFEDLKPAERIQATIDHVCTNGNLKKVFREESQWFIDWGRHSSSGDDTKNVQKSMIDADGNFHTSFNPYSPNYKPILNLRNSWTDYRSPK